MKTLAELRADLKALQNEYNSISTQCSQDDIECVSDRYQEALEATWYKRDLKDQMHELEEQIVNLELNAANNQIRRFEFSNPDRNRRWDNWNEQRYYALPDASIKRAAQHMNALVTNSINDGPDPDRCPSCGSYEGDAWSCPECGRNESKI